jgi:hypothetical protein
MPEKARIGQWPFDSDEFLDGRCYLCDNKAVACWSARNDLLVCEDCALNILPALIVDAMSKGDQIEIITHNLMSAAYARDQGWGGHGR